MGDRLTVARAALHLWEEPCLSGKNGAGTVFFSGCALGCVFCQNAEISQCGFGKELTVRQLADVFLQLQDQGAHNLDLVTPTHFAPWIAEALRLAKPQLNIPVVYNSGGYDSLEALREMEGLVEIYLPDFKYKDATMAARYSDAPDYFEAAQQALTEMYRQTGPVQWDEQGLLKRGVLVRHMILPGGRKDSMAVLDALAALLPVDKILLSLMSQYTPCHRAKEFTEINRRITTFEAESVQEHALKLGFSGYAQQRSAADTAFTPSFDLTGLPR